LVVGLLVSGCAAYEYLYGKPTRRESRQSDQDLLRSAETQVQRKRYDEARKDLQRLMNQYPDSELVAAARLATGKALYMDRKYDEARAELQRFLELHPQHERVDEAHYYMGMAYFRQADTPDRDQSYTKKALEEFEILKRQMPDSPFTPDASERIIAGRRKLAEKELYVGKFYFDRGNYSAAVGRFTTMLREYDGVGFDDQALYFLGESLWRLEQKDAARPVFQRVVQEHSQSEYAPPAANRLGVALVRMGPPKPKGPSTTDRVWQSLQEAWEELKDTATGYQIFR
jgi:outer membrane protein assembly factor BamD